MFTSRLSKIGKGVAVASLAATALTSAAVAPNVANAASLPHYTITMQLNQGSGAANAADNRVSMQLTKKYERMHPNITINWQSIAGNPSVTQLNSTLIARAAAHAAPDVVWEQYGPMNSGSLPQGILQNLKPYLMKPSPYAKGVG